MRTLDLTKQLFLVLALLGLTAADASAATYYDWDYIGPDELGGVSEGNPLQYQLSFTPDVAGEVNVLSARMGVILADAPNCTCGSAFRRYRCSLRDLLFEPEYALIETDGQFFAHSDLSPPWVTGDVTSLIDGAGDTLDVTLSSLQGSFRAKASWLVVKYEIVRRQVPGNPIPEPTSALLFAAGLLIATRRLRRA
jgi:hypothetical protein